MKEQVPSAEAHAVVRRPCQEPMLCDRVPCVVGPVYCPLCGCGPIEADQTFLHPVRVNHLAIWSCWPCLEVAVECLREESAAVQGAQTPR